MRSRPNFAPSWPFPQSVWPNRSDGSGQPVLEVRLGDTLCGTKLVAARDYQRMIEWRTDFGDFDPFGDFDLIFGAAKLNLKVLEIPIRYAGRSYGETQISRFRHGLLLLRMVIFAFTKLKAF